jgi:hypothetical protein
VVLAGAFFAADFLAADFFETAFLTGADVADFLDAFTAEARRAALATAPVTALIAEVVLAATWAPP